MGLRGPLWTTTRCTERRSSLWCRGSCKASMVAKTRPRPECPLIHARQALQRSGAALSGPHKRAQPLCLRTVRPTQARHTPSSATPRRAMLTRSFAHAACSPGSRGCPAGWRGWSHQQPAAPGLRTHNSSEHRHEIRCQVRPSLRTPNLRFRSIALRGRGAGCTQPAAADRAVVAWAACRSWKCTTRL